MRIDFHCPGGQLLSACGRLADLRVDEPFTVVDPPSRRGLGFSNDVKSDIRRILDKRAITPLACPLVWARETNQFDCVRWHEIVCDSLIHII